MAESLSAEKQKAYKEKFNKFDKNSDGKMSKAELPALLKALNRCPAPSKLDTILKGFDKDNSGCLEYDEFVQFMINLDADIDKGLKDTFDKFDADKNGFICSKELGDVFDDLGLDMTADEIQAELAGVDVNKDGKLSFDEFKKLFGRI